MDKWKDVELEKMKIGGNRNARVFFESQDDFRDGMPLSEKYNSKCAALYKDKVCALTTYDLGQYKLTNRMVHSMSIIIV